MKRNARISDYLSPRNIDIQVDSSSKLMLLDYLSSKASTDIKIDKDVILTGLLRREALGSTGVGGIAMPHSGGGLAKADISCGEQGGLTRPYMRLAQLSRPIDYNALDNLPVDIVLMILTPKESGSFSLRLLSNAARLLRSLPFCAAVRGASTGAQVYAALISEEIFSPPSGDFGRAA